MTKSPAQELRQLRQLRVELTARASDCRDAMFLARTPMIRRAYELQAVSYEAQATEKLRRIVELLEACPQ